MNDTSNEQIREIGQIYPAVNLQSCMQRHTLFELEAGFSGCAQGGKLKFC